MTVVRIVIQKLDEDGNIIEEIESGKCNVADFQNPKTFLHELSEKCKEDSHLLKKKLFDKMLES